jgi:hypothetical protein
MSTTQEVIETLAASPTVADLEQATRVSLADLVRFGSSATEQCIGNWGAGDQACAWSAAGLAFEALKSL